MVYMYCVCVQVARLQGLHQTELQALTAQHQQDLVLLHKAHNHARPPTGELLHKLLLYNIVCASMLYSHFLPSCRSSKAGKLSCRHLIIMDPLIFNSCPLYNLYQV